MFVQATGLRALLCRSDRRPFSSRFFSLRVKFIMKASNRGAAALVFVSRRISGVQTNTIESAKPNARLLPGHARRRDAVHVFLSQVQQGLQRVRWLERAQNRHHL